MPFFRRKQDTLSAKERHKARFYESYRKVAKEYDEEFLQTYGGDLDTTLIFVSII